MDLLNADTSPETHAIIGAALEVHTEFGPGFLEAVYQEALSAELRRRGIVHSRELAIPIFYKGEPLSTRYRADFIIGEFIVELKAITNLGRVEESQVVHYLRATKRTTGILLNFGSNSLQVRRLTNRPRPSLGLESPDSPDSPFG